MSIKHQIENALFDLADEKPLDKISVKDIVTHFGISRQSFYYHFQDMLEVVEWSFTQKM